MIESLELTNWKTHRDTKLTFQKGVNVMIGVMDAGKSSAMDAISYALFGTFPALKSKRVTTQELVMSRPAQEINLRNSRSQQPQRSLTHIIFGVKCNRFQKARNINQKLQGL